MDWNELMPQIEELEQNYAIQFQWFQRLKYLRVIMAEDNKAWEQIFDKRFYGEKFNAYKEGVTQLKQFMSTIDSDKYLIK